ncbi:MAG: MotA/TolQ/ExbB proton channel family protein, partial [Proteobacteria bacterium]|nr:MotA/TolQ/ExbB proton channel family protein [Pseudomonadota bacterium]
VIFTIGLVMERLAIFSFKEKGSKSFDKEFNSGEMLDAIYNRLYNKPQIHAPLARIFFVGMKELTQSNIRNIDFSMSYAEDIKRNIRSRMLAMTSVEKNHISMELKGGIAFLITIATIAPMIGLLGTMYGLMFDLHEFKDYAQIDTIHIVNALYSSITSTIIGIFGGIVAIAGYNILVSKINHITIENEIFAVKVANILSRELDLITANTHQKKALERGKSNEDAG